MYPNKKTPEMISMGICKIHIFRGILSLKRSRKRKSLWFLKYMIKTINTGNKKKLGWISFLLRKRASGTPMNKKMNSKLYLIFIGIE
jgi:hypothetical protein